MEADRQNVAVNPINEIPTLNFCYYTPIHRVGAILQSPCPSVRLSIRSHFRNRYLSFYWKKWFYIWYMALAWWLVPCLPFPGLPHIYFLFTVRLIIFHVCVMKTFVTDISASTGRNDFIFDTWLWHGDLYCVSPFQVYCTSTSCLPCDLEFFMFLLHFLVMSVEIFTNLTQMNEWGYS